TGPPVGSGATRWWATTGRRAPAVTSGRALGPHAGAHDLVAHHLVGEPQLALELGQPLGADLQVDDRVVALGGVVDLVGELALAPVVDPLHGAALLGDQRGEALHGALHRGLVESALRDHHQLVRAHGPSCGRWWPPRPVSAPHDA